MNSDRTAGSWKQIKGKVKEQWGKLTDNEIDQLEGKSEQLAGKLQEKYGLRRARFLRPTSRRQARSNRGQFKVSL
jgi:uncharacterized protein YjbJ (UPF0337 family)